MKKILLTLCAIPLALVCRGTEWAVSNSGSDSNSGAADSPFQTVRMAVSKAVPGDTIKLAPGIYREEITIQKSGSKDAPITFRGTRGANGEYLSVIEGVGKVLDAWEAAPEIAPGVWKMRLEKRPDLMLMDGKMIAYINSRTMALERKNLSPAMLNSEMLMSNFGPECKRLPGLDLLALSQDVRVDVGLLRDRKELLWGVLGNVLSGWRDGTLYVRFADGGTPEQHSFTASYGYGFTLKGASYWTFSDLQVRGCRYQFKLQGKCTGNRIENSLMMHGGARIWLTKDVTDTVIQNNILTAGFIQSEHFGLRSKDDMRGGLLYLVFKYIIGTSSSDDVGVRDQGTGNRILDNIFLRGLIGIDAYGVNCEFAGNVVREMSSIGICTLESTVGKFHHNLVMNCGILLRFHHIRHTRDKREEYHYCNLFYQAPHDGSMTFLHSESQSCPADRDNFEPGTSTYKKVQPNPVDPGTFYIYHNTFWGGDDWVAAVDFRSKAKKFGIKLPFYVMNNIVKYTTRPSESYLPRYTLDYQAALAGNLFYRNIDRPAYVPPEEAGVLRLNKILEKEQADTVWNGKSTYGLPDVTLGAESPALGCGVDLSRPSVIDGTAIPALPGMEKMKQKPDAGALQSGESQQRFFDMHKKAEEALKMLKGKM